MAENTRREIISASMIGTIVEWYGIFIFSSGAFYIAKVFYPFTSPTLAILLTLLTFALGFITRPVGAFVFGHFGDRIGRKAMLLLTLMISGIATGLTGLIPSYATIGFSAVIILIILRLVLGFGLGGEWGGAMLLTLENVKGKRGFWSSFVQSTVGIGLLIGTGVFLAIESFLPTSLMVSFGWRIPFLLSFVMVIIGVFIRFRIKETPVFQEAVEKKNIAKTPAAVLFKKHWRLVLGGTLLAGSSGNFFYFAVALIPTLFESNGSISPHIGLIGITIFAILDIIFVFIGGYFSDRRGRRAAIAGANILALIILYPSMYLVSPMWFMLFLSIFGIAHGFSYSPVGALISEVFPTNVRYSGNSMSYQFGNAFIGGPAPYASDWLGGFSFVLYPVFTLIFILIALGTIFKLKESKDIKLDASYDTTTT